MKNNSTRRASCPLCGEVSRANSRKPERPSKEQVWKCPYCGQKRNLRRELIQKLR